MGNNRNYGYEWDDFEQSEREGSLGIILRKLLNGLVGKEE